MALLTPLPFVPNYHAIKHICCTLEIHWTLATRLRSRLPVLKTHTAQPRCGAVKPMTKPWIGDFRRQYNNDNDNNGNDSSISSSSSDKCSCYSCIRLIILFLASVPCCDLCGCLKPHMEDISCQVGNEVQVAVMRLSVFEDPALYIDAH